MIVVVVGGMIIEEMVVEGMVVEGMVVIGGVFIYFEILARCPASASGL
jgi:hypothetical protein